ncbi:bifunctional adenosylcobinamide kinase/adenosylcobinamide-phosphate guanylyltransferase [Bacillus sp. FJAT-45037]|uniref:bifunctional adenosylcobinamide kinase/adenosylcobinamide-phosphate guanylyltransferase n=1 Tax=Bacillus sp. FJAT-45037 TaxID=2011007 RepID=UPI000C232B78
MEQLIKELLNNGSIEESRDSFRQWLHFGLEWEAKNKGFQLLLIGSDIGKGIVPVNASDRNWRDLVGWCYQDIVKQAKVVQLVWYGLNQELKNEEE